MESKMKLIRNLLSLTLAFCLFTAFSINADEQDNSRFDEELNERDFDALRDYLRSKRAVDIEESTSTLSISGDVRTEWRHMNETCNHMRRRGHDIKDLSGRPVSRNDFDIEFNLYFDYVTEKTWATAQVRYDNSAGVDDNGHPCGPVNKYKKGCCEEQARHCIGDPEGYHGSGNCTDLCLKKAFMGYELYADDDSRFFFELGRRGNLYNAFESNIQFLSRFDGLLLKYERSWECIADCYLTTAGFVVDERVNHFAWAAEIGFLDIGDNGIDFKYSIINWEKHGTNRCGARNPAGFRFINSQFTSIYHLKPEWLGVKAKIYGAFLVNHAARKIHTVTTEEPYIDENGNPKIKYIDSHYKFKNLGWYVGVLFGEVRKEGDWAIEIQYQYVQAQAMPDDDAAGICRGNNLDESFTTCSRRGNTNYKGWRFEGLYAFTDNLTLDTIFEFSKAEDNGIGGKHTYSKFEMEAIYAF